jgi:hypothetical protein
VTTSGTATFNLDITEIVEEAYEQAGSEMRTGYDLRTARRSLNLLALDWANRGYNLWTIEQASVPLIISVDTYALPADTIDIVEAVIRTTSGSTNTDISISRIGAQAYATIPVKTTTGRPSQFWLNRQIVPQISVWPLPSASSLYTFIYWRMRRIQDVGASGELTFDIPHRFLPCLVSGLAYKLAMKNPEMAQRIPMLKQEYEDQWNLASSEDREKVPYRIRPPRMSI